MRNSLIYEPESLHKSGIEDCLHCGDIFGGALFHAMQNGIVRMILQE
ncbi:hypothetical protein HMPREF9555_01498 [Selenomonas artemidis F0399]|uniref:Uncharacterized protein n=1 Tax=Selenomonas artemidis F0399 TaxID=749551 RepID=E7N3C3_9FIRM|nr:hypothetical protein HMPREF9555_01498 [Selenomonas artemidis F0399]